MYIVYTLYIQYNNLNYIILWQSCSLKYYYNVHFENDFVDFIDLFNRTYRFDKFKLASFDI